VKEIKITFYKKISPFLSYFFLIIFAFLSILIIFKGDPGDAYENIVGGWLITKGLVLYKDQFATRAPLMYYFAGFVHFALGMKIIYFRIFLLLIYLTLSFYLSFFLRKSIKNAFLFSLIFFPLSVRFFHSQTFLADNLLAFCLLGLLVVFFQFWGRKKFLIKLKLLIAVLIFMAVNSSSIAVIPVGILLFFSLIQDIFMVKEKVIVVVRKYLFFLLPTLIFPFYFFIKGGLSDFLWTMFSYSQHYFLNRIGEPHEVRYGRLGFWYRLVINFGEYLVSSSTELFNSIWNFFTALRFFNPILFYKTQQGFIDWQDFISKYLNYIFIIISEFYKNIFAFEMIIFLAYLSFVVYLIKRKKTLFALFLVLFMMGLRSRDNEIFHLAPFYLVGYWVLSYLFFKTFKFIKQGNKRSLVESLIGYLSASLIIGLIFNLFPGYMLFNRSNNPIVREDIVRKARLIRENSGKNDKIWIAGGNPAYYMLSSRLPVTKYYFYFPFVYKVKKIRTKAKEELIGNQPEIIYTQEEAVYFVREVFENLEDNYYELEKNLFIKY